MKISRPANAGSRGPIWFRTEIVRTPGIAVFERVSTRVMRLGSGWPMESKVLLPMTMTWPVVFRLNHWKSSGRCHGMRLPAPITRLRDMAATALNGFTNRETGKGQAAGHFCDATGSPFDQPYRPRWLKGARPAGRNRHLQGPSCGPYIFGPVRELRIPPLRGR